MFLKFLLINFIYCIEMYLISLTTWLVCLFSLDGPPWHSFGISISIENHSTCPHAIVN